MRSRRVLYFIQKNMNLKPHPHSMPMRYALFCVLILTVFLLLPFLSFAEGGSSQLAVKIISKAKVVKPPATLNYTILITNRGDTPKEIEILISSSQITWYYVYPSYLRLSPGETGRAILRISPPSGTPSGLYEFFVIVRDKNNPSNEVRVEDTVYVEKSIKLSLVKVETSKTTYEMGEPIIIKAGVRNDGSEDTSGYHIYVIAEVNGITGKKILKAKVPDLKVNESRLITFNLTLDPHRARGKYLVTVKLEDGAGDVLDEKKTEFTILGKVLMNKTKRVEKKLLEKIITITVTNLGNEKGVVTITELKKYPDFAYIIFNETPPEIIKIDGKEYFRWTCELGPLDSCTVKYGINYWPFLFILIAVFFIFLVIFEILQYPRIKKTHRKTSSEEHRVYITIKNRGKRTLHNVEVIDEVPGVFQVIRDFEVGKPAEIKKVGGATRMIWKFSTLKPGEERVISYKIKPLLHIEGRIKLPSVEVRAFLGRRKIRVRSGEIMTN